MNDSNLLQDQAFYEIRRRIQNGEYPPGTKLVAQEISKSLNISRTPVVAALNRLIAHKIVEPLPNRGVVVAKITPQRMLESIDIRLMIEHFCAKSVIKNINFFPDVVAEMRDIIENLQNENEIDSAYELDNRFHTLYVKMANNQMLLDLYINNWSVGCIYQLWTSMQNGLEILRTSYVENSRLLELCLEGDEEALKAAISKHIQFVYDTVEWYIRRGN